MSSLTDVLFTCKFTFFSFPLFILNISKLGVHIPFEKSQSIHSLALLLDSLDSKFSKKNLSPFVTISHRSRFNV